LQTDEFSTVVLCSTESENAMCIEVRVLSERINLERERERDFKKRSEK